MNFVQDFKVTPSMEELDRELHFVSLGQATDKKSKSFYQFIEASQV